MADTTCTITGIIKNPDGSPVANATIPFEPDGDNYTSNAQYIKSVVNGATDANGALMAAGGTSPTANPLTLWVNGEGELPTNYICTLPDKTQFRFSIPTSTTTLTLAQARTLGLTPNTAQYQTVLDYINTNFPGSGSGVTITDNGDGTLTLTT